MKPIKTEASYQKALGRIEELWGAPPDTPEGDEVEILMVPVEAYENKHHPIPPSDPVNAILFQADRLGMDSQVPTPGRFSPGSGRKSKMMGWRFTP